LPTARLLALTLLIATHAIAQSHLLNQMPLEVRKDEVRSDEVRHEINPTSGIGSTPATPASLPDAPSRHRVIDKKFIAVMGALGGAETLRFTSRKLVLDHEFAAGAPWISHVPTNQHVVAGHAGIFAAELLVAYELKKPHSWLPGDKVIRKLWWAYPSAMVAVHIKNGVDNMRTQGPGGCTSVECAEQMQGGDLRRR
jgi:hypothetical protein